MPVSLDSWGPDAGGSAALWRVFSLLPPEFLFPPLNYSAYSNWHSRSTVVLIDLVKSFGCCFFMLAYLHIHIRAYGHMPFLFSMECVVFLMGFGWLQTNADDNSLRGYTVFFTFSCVCVCVLFIRCAVLWLEAMSWRVVTATEQTWVYSLALFLYFWACLAPFSSLSPSLSTFLSPSPPLLSIPPSLYTFLSVVMSGWHSML